VSFAVTPVANFAGWNRPGPQSSPPSYSAPREYLNGQTIDASATFASTVTVGWTNGFQPFRNDYGIVQFTPPNGPTIINITPPDDFVVGLKLNMSGQDYFGWMAVHWLVDSRSGYNITRWACETTPNTPIAVPAPGVCGVAAAGLLAAIRRRRRVASEARPPLPGTATVSGQGGGSACGRVR
jgi:hypothetical protein